MSQAPYMPLFVDAYLADTTHLTAEESGAYLHLLMAMWRHGGSVPNDDRDLARIARVSPSRWPRVKARIMPLLTLNPDGRLSQKRLTKEWHASQASAKPTAETRCRVGPGAAAITMG